MKKKCHVRWWNGHYFWCILKSSMTFELFILWKWLILHESHCMQMIKTPSKSSSFFFEKNMKNMPFPMMKRTLFWMYLKIIDDFQRFHFMKMINFAWKPLHENDASSKTCNENSDEHKVLDFFHLSYCQTQVKWLNQDFSQSPGYPVKKSQIL